MGGNLAARWQLIQPGEFDEAPRLAGVLTQGRAALRPWQDSRAVRELDDRLAAYGLL